MSVQHLDLIMGFRFDNKRTKFVSASCHTSRDDEISLIACLFFQGNCEIYIPRWVRISWTTLTFSARVRRTCDKMAKTWPTACAFLRSTDNRWWMAAAQSSTQTASQNWLMNSLCIQLGMWRGKTRVCVWEREKENDYSHPLRFQLHKSKWVITCGRTQVYQTSYQTQQHF